ncbi:hypothetical protein ACF1HJ_32140 [Streptomyces sp. NPDC013978]|uniref:hypothetical protein n=1 Tax=Streptomyces sp. NPDC013978 TaxID=3364869 RepID=UPI0036FAB390
MKIDRLAERYLLGALETLGGGGFDFTPNLILEPARLDQSDLDAIVMWLVGASYVNVISENAAGTAEVIELTGRGLEYAEHLRETSGSKLDRDTYLHNVLVRWAYNQSPPGGSASLQMFAASDDWWFSGTEVTWDEVDAAVDYLEAKGLLVVARAIGATHIRPTPLGADFARSKQMLRTFMSSQQPNSSTVTNNYHHSNIVQGDARGSNFASGDNATQTVNHGVDADAFAALITQLRDVVPHLELSQEDREDLTEEIDTLAGEQTDPGAARRTWRRVKRIIVPAATTVLAEQAVQAAIAGGTGLLG